MRSEQREQRVGAVARHDHHGAVLEAVEEVGRGHGAHDDAARLARQQRRIARDQRALDGVEQLLHGRCHQDGVLGDHAQAQVGGKQSRDRVDVRGAGPVDEHPDHARVRAGELGASLLDHLGDLGGRALVSVHHEHDGRAQVRGDASVELELGRGRHVGVVGADDHDEVTQALDFVIARHDGLERALGVRVDVVVGHADRLLVRQVDAVVTQQELEDIVRTVGDARDGAEDPHPAHLLGDEVGDAQCDGRLARVPLGGGDVDASCHGPIVS
ncbi:hypothetical protein GCM10025873_26980 [Demequina sediminis]|nr:hypothetical protein GCM10025873_26980 [Demequina sediminis]